MTKKILYILGAIAVVILGAVGWAVFHPGGSLAFPSNINSINLVPNTTVGGDTYALAMNGTTIINTTGTIQLSGTNSCNTATINTITSLGFSSVSSSVTSTNISLLGSVMGNFCIGSLTSATSSAAQIECDITSNGTATLSVVNAGGSSLTLATGTAKVCLLQ